MPRILYSTKSHILILVLFPTWRDWKNFYSWLHQVLASYCIKIISPAYLFPLVFQYKLQEETRWHHPPTCVEIFTRSPSSLGTFFIFHVTSGSGIATFCLYITRIPFLWYSVTFFLVLFNLSPAASSKAIQVLRKVTSRHFRFSRTLFFFQLPPTAQFPSHSHTSVFVITSLHF